MNPAAPASTCTKNPSRSNASEGGISAKQIATAVVSRPDAVPKQAAGPPSGNRNRRRLSRDFRTQSNRRREHVQIRNEVDDQRRIHELEVRSLDRVALSGGQYE